MRSVEQVVGAAAARRALGARDRSLSGGEPDGVVQRLTLRRISGALAHALRVGVLPWQLRRDESAVGREGVRLPVVEVQLSRRADLLLRASDVLDVGQSDGDLVLAGALDLRLADAELVDAGADDVERPIERLRRDGRHLRRRLTSVDELDAALQVEAETRRLERDGERRRGQQAGDEKQDEAVAATVGHAPSILLRRREHEQQTAVVVVGGKQVGDGLRRQVALRVDRHALVQRADAPL